MGRLRMPGSAMKRSIVVYSLAMAAGAFGLKWLEFQYVVRVFPFEMYVALIATAFAALGMWVGLRLRSGGRGADFQPNTRALEYLGISKREFDVLELLAQGHSNQEIAAALYVSGNTVKSHLSRLYQKLEVSRRTQAVQKARALRLIP